MLIRVCWKARWSNFYCYKCLCKLFNIFWCFRFENWYDNSVSINSIFVDKINSPNSKINNYRLLTPNTFIDFYWISKKLIYFYRLLSNVIDWLPQGYYIDLKRWLLTTFRHHLQLFATVRHFSQYLGLFAIRDYSLFAIWVFQTSYALLLNNYVWCFYPIAV